MNNSHNFLTAGPSYLLKFMLRSCVEKRMLLVQCKARNDIIHISGQVSISVNVYLLLFGQKTNFKIKASFLHHHQAADINLSESLCILLYFSLFVRNKQTEKEN